MKLTIALSTVMIFLLLITVTDSSNVEAAGFEVGVGQADCSGLKREIRRDWYELQSFYRPKSKETERPKSKDFYCVAPGYAQHAFAKASVSSEYKCYTMQTSNFCCDRQHKACVGM